MAYAEGVVRGHVYGGRGWEDCSRPCMWLDRGFCRLRKTAELECVRDAWPSGEARTSSARRKGRAVVRDDGLRFERVGDACLHSGASPGSTANISRAIREGRRAYGHCWRYEEDE